MDTETDTRRGMLMLRHRERLKAEIEGYKNQEMTKIARKSPETGRRGWDRFFLMALGRTQPCSHPESGLLAPRTVAISSVFLAPQFVVLCDDNSRKLTHHPRTGSVGCG